MRRSVVLVVVWLAGTAIAVTLSTAAVGQISERVTDRAVASVSADEVERELESGEPLEPLEAPGSEHDDETEGDDEAEGDDGTGDGDDADAVTSTSGAVAPPAAGSDVGSGDGDEADDADVVPTPPSAPVSTAAPTGTEVTRAFSAAGGTATVGCTDASIRLIAYAPVAGWVVDGAPKNGPTEVEVKFRSGDRHAELKARCQAGVPVAEVSTSGADDDESDESED
ncbi:MAG: hypothetical protein MUF83_12850 [Acidimicrobiales bacterium]|jgi:hypothetical protein|nr:hypothetical protein [Acidimicrobiales bacterium]